MFISDPLKVHTNPSRCGSLSSFVLFWKRRRKLSFIRIHRRRHHPIRSVHTHGGDRPSGFGRDESPSAFSVSVWRKENTQGGEGRKITEHRQILKSSAWKLRWINLIFCGKQDLSSLYFFFQLVHPPRLLVTYFRPPLWSELNSSREGKLRTR